MGGGGTRGGRGDRKGESEGSDKGNPVEAEVGENCDMGRG